MIPTYDASSNSMPPLFPEAGEGRYAPPPLFVPAPPAFVPPTRIARKRGTSWLKKSTIGAAGLMLCGVLAAAVLNFWPPLH